MLDNQPDPYRVPKLRRAIAWLPIVAFVVWGLGCYVLLSLTGKW